jgi:cell cycle checkpoint control protein RAD9A
MAVLNFTLSEEGVSAFRDALICLNKFSDDVSLEARKDSVNLSQTIPKSWLQDALLTSHVPVRFEYYKQLQVRLCQLQVCHQSVFLTLFLPCYGAVP